MEYSCYKDAFDAVVADNDGVLPDLYEVFDFMIYCRPSYLTGFPTVAEIVAYALIETAESQVVTVGAPLVAPLLSCVPVLVGEPLCLNELLAPAGLSLN